MQRILVVDDDPANAIILVKLLEHCGYDAKFELSGDAALKTAAVFEPDVVFVDLALPGLNGYEIAGQLKNHRSNGRPKVVSLTGYARGQGHGDDSIFDDYVLKPVNVTTLRRVIDGEDGKRAEADRRLSNQSTCISLVQAPASR